MCAGKIEHLRHLFFECHFAKECWRQAGLNCEVWSVENSHEWVLQKMDNGTEDELIKIDSVLWGVWYARNKHIFENKKMTSSTVIS